MAKRDKNPKPTPAGVTPKVVRAKKHCPTCQGNGQRRISTYDKNNTLVSIEYETCNVCNGTGLK